jgi:tetratricopeptide (TPR) repeat protein
MRARSLFSLLVGLLVAPLTAAAQMPTEATLRQQIRTAEAATASLDQLLDGVVAARLLEDHALAKRLFERADSSFDVVANRLIDNALQNELSAGAGVGGMQRAFRAMRKKIVLEPQEIGTWLTTAPELYVGGEFDDLVAAFSPTAPDPRYRCSCYTQKGWAARIAGDMDKARAYWDSAMAVADRNPPPATRQARAQRVRDLARAGRTADARAFMQTALATDKWEDLNGLERFRWAQAYGELGDVEKAVEVLEGLLDDPTLVNVAFLHDRVSLAPIRAHPAFQALLARHRKP